MTQRLPTPLASTRLGPALSPEAFSRVRRRMVLEHFKWDPQIGDESILLEQPLVLDTKTWAELASIAERMAAEITSVEMELLARPDLQSVLALPASLRRALRGVNPAAAGAALRVLRFDFHPTTEGWKISEVNSDVPGGFTESSHFAALMAEHYPTARPAGNPLRAWKRAMTSLLSARHVAILYAPGYPEDQQHVSLLGALLEEEGGCQVHFIQNPKRLSWRGGWACLDLQPLDVIVRFFQCEWLAELPRQWGWPQLFAKSHTVVTNPGYALLAESKRLPLLWERLKSSIPVLEEMFPPCREPRDVRSGEDEWVFKSAYSNTGDDVIIPSLLAKDAWQQIRREIQQHPGRWVAQRRFFSLPVCANSGVWLYPCIGIYTIDGRSEGAYVRLSRGPVTDYRAMEAALLIADELESVL